ncbi:MFS general substrate transporter [Hypoxylon trugodes]|uniref:MFS general substrate transporter n=1 Tax=Hypoxylon trugodes TaxID=326681 RepID=UPI002199C530|nr:MFS general substrate transporter [Hypoxylon trugodes]KAI1392244.1 MFS general substrate transporter [Hypoxylon trugodes]
MPYRNPVHGWRQTTLITTQLVGLLFSAIDASIVSTSLVTISISLQDFLDAPWVVLAYLLAYFGFAIGFAKLSDIYGRRDMVCCSWVLFVGFSIGCACATTMAQLIVCRVFQGMGGAGLYSLSQIVLFEAGPKSRPSLMGGLVGVTLAVSYVLGPILGAVISSTTKWPIIFWINVPAGFIVVLAILLASPPETVTRQRGWASIRKIDFVGNVSVISACTLLVFALQEAGAYTYAWDNPVVVVSLSIASLSWIIFFTWEIYLGFKRATHIEPILPLRLFLRRVYTSCVICTFCTGYVYLSILIILPERFQIVNGETALYAGIHLLPMLGATSFGAFSAGAISRKRNNTSWTMMIAHAFQLLGIGLMSMLREATAETKAQYGFQALLGLGFGLSLGAGTIMASVQSYSQDLAVAQGTIAQARVFGGAIGIAVCSIIFNRKVTTELGSKMDPADLAALHHSPTIAPWLPEDIKSLVRSVYASAFTYDVNVMIGIAAAGLIASAFTYQRRPPAMSTVQQTKEVLGIDGQSDTELRLVNHP